MFTPHFQFVSSKLIYNIKKTLFTDLRVQILEVISKVPGIGTQSLKDKVKMLKRSYSKLYEVLDTFQYYFTKEWIFMNENIYKVLEHLSEEEK